MAVTAADSPNAANVISDLIAEFDAQPHQDYTQPLLSTHARLQIELDRKRRFEEAIEATERDVDEFLQRHAQHIKLYHNRVDALRFYENPNRKILLEEREEFLQRQAKAKENYAEIIANSDAYQHIPWYVYVSRERIAHGKHYMSSCIMPRIESLQAEVDSSSAVAP